MKKYSIIFFAITILFFLYVPKTTIAAGQFELNDCPDIINAVAGQEYKTYFSFFYSGTQYMPSANFIGTNFPPGLHNQGVVSGGGGSYSFLYSGTPTMPGDYKITLALTDNYGAFLNKKVEVKVSGLVFSDDPIPHAKKGVHYSQDIHFTYAGKENPLISITNTNTDLLFEYIRSYSPDGSFKLKFISNNPGTYNIKLSAVVNGAELGNKDYTLVVDGPESVSAVEQVPTPVIKDTASIEKDLNTEKIHETKKVDQVSNKVSKNEKVEKSTKSPEMSAVTPQKISWYKRILNWFRK